MPYLFIVAGLLAGVCIMVMSSATAVANPLLLEAAAVAFALSTGVSTLAVAAIEG